MEKKQVILLESIVPSKQNITDAEDRTEARYEELVYGCIDIRGHKGQNSTGTRCRGFLVLESRCRGFSALESRCRGFLSSEKMSWNHDVVG